MRTTYQSTQTYYWYIVPLIQVRDVELSGHDACQLWLAEVHLHLQHDFNRKALHTFVCAVGRCRRYSSV